MKCMMQKVVDTAQSGQFRSVPINVKPKWRPMKNKEKLNLPITRYYHVFASIKVGLMIEH